MKTQTYSDGLALDDGRIHRRQITRASSLDDSKKRAKSSYDNIRDLNEQYLAELAWVERNYGRERLGDKDLITEAQNNIIVRDGKKRSSTKAGRNETTETSADDTTSMGGEKKSDMSGYIKMRNRLIGDTAFVGALGLCSTWLISDDLKNVFSFALGVAVAIAYVTLLARSVDRMADAARVSGGSSGAADPLQAARVGLLAVSVIGAAKNADRFSVLGVILGFLTYKLATLIPLITGEAFES